MSKAKQYSADVRKRAVRLVPDNQHQHPCQWAAISSIAEKIRCRAETLRKWVRQAEQDSGERRGLTTQGRTRLKELDRENRALRRADEIPRRRATLE